MFCLQDFNSSNNNQLEGHPINKIRGSSNKKPCYLTKLKHRKVQVKGVDKTIRLQQACEKQEDKFLVKSSAEKSKFSFIVYC